MRIGITGATGLVGANVAEIALHLGHEVVCTKRASSKTAHLAHLDIEWKEADLEHEAQLAQAFLGCEVIVHAAAEVSGGQKLTPAMRETNVAGTRRVIGACRSANVRRLVHVSSVAATGLSDGTRDVTEDDPFNFAEHGLLDGYVETKRAAQDLVLAAVVDGLDAVVVCPTFMFGPYDIKPSSGQLIVAVAKGQIPVATDGSQNIVDVRDVARGILLAADNGRSGQLYILGGENVTYAEMFARIARVGGWTPPTRRVPRWIAQAGGLAGDLFGALGGTALLNSMTVRWAHEKGFRFSSDKAKQELGYSPGSPDEGIRACIAWMREQKMV